MTLDYLWYAEESRHTPLFNEHGVAVGVFGAKDYTNRWSVAWRDQIKAASPAGSFPPFSPSATPLRPDQVR